MRTRENFPVGHPSQIAPSQARLIWRFFQDILPKKMYLVGMDTLLVLLSLGPGNHHPRGTGYHISAIGGKFWKIARDGFVVLKQDDPTTSDEENILVNDQAMNVLYDALDINEFNRIKNLTTTHEIWTKLMKIHEETAIVKSAKLYVF
jgi:hypothetical protein